jgi:hypothetical protein
VPEIWAGPSAALGNAPHASPPAHSSGGGGGGSEVAGAGGAGAAAAAAAGCGGGGGGGGGGEPIDFTTARFWSVFVVDAPGPAGTTLFRSDLFDEAPAAALPLMISEPGSAACGNGSATAGCARPLGGNPTDSVMLQSKAAPGCAAPLAKQDHSFAIYTASPCEKTAFLSLLYIKTNMLPRQARDKHRANSKNMPFSQVLQFARAAGRGFEVRGSVRQSHGGGDVHRQRPGD